MPGVGISAATTRLSRVPELVWGTTPASPGYKNMRIVSESLAGEKQTTRSNELRSDRNVTDEILTALTASGSIESELSYGSFDMDFENLFFNTWTTDTLINGVTPKFFTFEKTNDKPDGSKLYQRFRGGMYNTLSLGITAGEIITSTWGVMAKTVENGSAILTGATYADGGTSDVMSAGAHVGAITATGIADSPIIQSMTIDITNNLRQRMAVGTVGLVGIGEGRYEVSGSLNAYFSTQALLDAFLNHTALGLNFTLGNVAGSRYRMTLPKIKLTAGSLVGGGNDSDLMLNANFTALYDATTLGTLKLERNV